MTTALDHDTAKELIENLIGNEQYEIDNNCSWLFSGIAQQAAAKQLDDLLCNWDVIEVTELAELRRKAAYYDTLHISAEQAGDR